MGRFCIPRLLGGLFIGLLPLAAGAGQHHICFESEVQQALPTAVWGCHEDAGGSCRISGLAQAVATLSTLPPAGVPGSFRSVQLQSAGTFSATIDFFDAAGQPSGNRTCGVSVVGANGFGVRGAASPGAQLTGYTTDASGLVTTGVWKLTSSIVDSFSRLAVQVPKDFVAVGGGVVGAETPSGALVTESCQSDLCGFGSGDFRRWRGRTSDLVTAQPHQTTVHAIGLRIAGLSASQLQALLVRSGQDDFPAIASAPTSRASLPATLGGSVPVGNPVPLSGGVAAFADTTSSPQTLLGQFVTETAPIVLQSGLPVACRIGVPCLPRQYLGGWKSASKDHLVAHLGIVYTTLLALPPAITVGGRSFQVVAKWVLATSAQAAHPAVDVSGLRGEYALIGIGASVDWRCYDALGRQVAAGNLLWRLEPRPDLGGATVASKDHGVSSSAAFTGYALGIKLVP